MRSETVRIEERYRYLQLDHNNILVKLEETSTKLEERTTDLKVVRLKYSDMIKTNEQNVKQLVKIRKENTFYITVILMLLLSNLFCIFCDKFF